MELPNPVFRSADLFVAPLISFRQGASNAREPPLANDKNGTICIRLTASRSTASGARTNPQRAVTLNAPHVGCSVVLCRLRLLGFAPRLSFGNLSKDTKSLID